MHSYRMEKSLMKNNWVGINSEQESISIFSIGGYFLFLGGSLDIGFNLNNFLYEMDEAFSK